MISLLLPTSVYQNWNSSYNYTWIERTRLYSGSRVDRCYFNGVIEYCTYEEIKGNVNEFMKQFPLY